MKEAFPLKQHALEYRYLYRTLSLFRRVPKASLPVLQADITGSEQGRISRDPSEGFTCF